MFSFLRGYDTKWFTIICFPYFSCCESVNFVIPFHDYIFINRKKIQFSNILFLETLSFNNFIKHRKVLPSNIKPSALFSARKLPSGQLLPLSLTPPPHLAITTISAIFVVRRPNRATLTCSFKPGHFLSLVWVPILNRNVWGIIILVYCLVLLWCKLYYGPPY